MWLSSDGGALLLREAGKVFGEISRLAGCLSDHRDPGRSGHGLDCLVGQRVVAIALGCEDLNDHDQQNDDITGTDRLRDGGHSLANRFRPLKMLLSGH